MNLFEYKFENGEFITSESYYGALDSIEAFNAEKSSLTFDSVETFEFEKIKNGNFWKNENISALIINVQISNELIHLFQKKRNIKILEGKWFRIETTPVETGLNASRAQDEKEFPETQEIRISRIQLIQKSEIILQQLKSFFAFKDSNRSNYHLIKKHLFEINPNREKYNYNVYNVGQGSLTALTCDKNTPLIYYDLGGAFWIFPDSYPVTLNICTKQAKTIILSHWDLDHIETARRLFHSKPQQLKGITWIVPKQDLSPFYASIARKMMESGNLIFWSGAGSNNIEFWGGTLLKCKGSNKNDSGIAILLKKIYGNDCILNPGDSKFKYISGVDLSNLTGLVATHHGANFDFENTPNSASGGLIAISHENKYGHPTLNAVEAYETRGWVNRLDTIDGSISFSFCRANVPSGCNNRLCNLSIPQIFI